MNAKIGVCLMAIVLIFEMGLRGQDSTASAPARAQSPPAPSVRSDLHLTKIIVHLRDGSVLYGFLEALEPEALVIRKAPSPVRVKPWEIKKVVLDTGKDALPYVCTGMLSGIYVGNLVFGRSGRQPTAFLDNEGWSAWGYVFTNLIYAAGGIGAGFLASLFEKSDRAFSFSENPAVGAGEWQRLKDYLSGGPGSRKVCFSLQAAVVFPSLTRRYAEILKDAGFEDEGRTPGRFNLLRGLRLTYFVKPRLEIGAAAVFLGEPDRSAYRWNGQSGHAAARFDARGYYAVAAVHPLAAQTRRGALWKVGLGLGAARVRSEIALIRYNYLYPYSETTAGRSIAETVFSPLLFTEVQIPVMKGLSIGFQADYAALPSESFPAFPDWNLPGQKIRLGNGSVGAVLGWHF